MDKHIDCKGLGLRYGEQHVLKDLHLQVKPGGIVGLLGPNGSGKTTLMKLAMGLMQPTAGEVLLFGLRPGVETKAAVSYHPEHLALPLWMKVSQILEFYEDFFADFDRSAAEEMLKNLEIPLHPTLKILSKGAREKVQLTMAMSRRAKLYLLDEPIAGVDAATRDYMLQSLLQNYRPEATVVISTHLIADVEKILDEVILLQHGSILLHSTVDDIRNERGMTLDAFFKEEFRCSENS